MKTLWIVIGSAALGALLGVGTSWARIGWDTAPPPLLLAPEESAHAPTFAPVEGPPPKVVVEADEYDFGSVAYDQTVEHAFRFTNRGESPLQLEAGGTTCVKCTISRLPDDPIAPGESADVIVEYHATAAEFDFRQSATILTNDPKTPRVVLSVEGKIIVETKIKPTKLIFSRLAVTQAGRAAVRVFAYFDRDFAIESFELTDPDTARFFDVAIEPLSAADVEAESAKAGYEVQVTVKPGMPLGPLRQVLLLHTNLAAMPELRVPVEGNVDSDISLAGAGFDRDSGILNIGPTSRRTGAERKLLVLIRGGQRHAVHVRVASCDPPSLQATLGEPADLNTGAVVQIPLIVKIPPGSPPANHMVNYGQIQLETDHADAKQIRIWVQFAVED
ncbi:MAG TPA: DUF1573 domain-containing protein [Pirellulales bacterium]|jgi:hypothetical protein|nr:DUF1573 domain-containing protein [Pirellulales bacterium]